MGRAMLSKYLIQFSVDRLGCVPSPFFDLRPNYGGGNEDNGDLLQKDLTYLVPLMLQQATFNASAVDSWTVWVTGMSGSVSCGVTGPFSWVLMCTRFCLCLLRVCFPSPVQVLVSLLLLLLSHFSRVRLCVTP